ncbi:MAG: hypothetical protein RNU03_20935 [Candidatus Sedimenticola sp. (ex Thyasira tokunagai)]
MYTEDGASVAMVAGNINASSLIARKGYQGSGGAQITTSATSYTAAIGYNADRELSADGAGTLLDLSSLTTLTRSETNAADVRINATDGGTVTLTGISTFTDNPNGNGTGRILISSTGTGSDVNLSGMTTMKGGDVTLNSGGVVQLGSLSSFRDGRITMDSSASAQDVRVADSFSLGGGGIIDLTGAQSGFVIGNPGVQAVTAGSVNVFETGVFTGSGVVKGTLLNGGDVGPGNSPGVLTVDNYMHTPDGTLMIELGGLVVGTEYDVLNVIDTAALDGMLELSIINGFTPMEGNVFDIITAENITGTFDQLLLLGTAADYMWDIQILQNEVGTIDVLRLTAGAAAVPLPSAVWLFLSAAVCLVGIGRRKKSDHP